MATTTGDSVDNILKETEIGEVIMRHKGLAIGFVVGVLLAVLGYGVYSHLRDKSYTEFSDQIYTFKSTTLTSFREDKVTVAEVMEKLKGMKKEMGSYQGLVPLLMATSDELVEKDKLPEAEEILKLGESSVSNVYLKYLYSIRLAAIYEDTDRPKDAIDLLLALTNGDHKLMEGKLYVDIGRLYLQAGDKDKARDSFQYVLDNTTDAEFVKLARLYLSGLK